MFRSHTQSLGNPGKNPRQMLATMRGSRWPRVAAGGEGQASMAVGQQRAVVGTGLGGTDPFTREGSRGPGTGWSHSLSYADLCPLPICETE